MFDALSDDVLRHLVTAHVHPRDAVRLAATGRAMRACLGPLVLEQRTALRRAVDEGLEAVLDVAKPLREGRECPGWDVQVMPWSSATERTQVLPSGWGKLRWAVYTCPPRSLDRVKVQAYDVTNCIDGGRERHLGQLELLPDWGMDNCVIRRVLDPVSAAVCSAMFEAWQRSQGASVNSLAST